MPEKPFDYRIAVLGGGTGQFNVLRGLVELNNPEKITAIPGTWDSGGSSGRLRTELGVLPGGDARRCLIACMDDDEQREYAIQLFNDRIDGFGKTLDGHSVGNLIIACLEKHNLGHDKGLNAARKLFRIQSDIAPSALNHLTLISKLQSGVELEGEDKLDSRHRLPDFNSNDFITSIYFDTKPQPNPKALEALLQADKIVISMGSLYGSILPHFLVHKIREAIINSNAKLIFIANIMTERGQTDNFKTVSDHLKPLARYLRDANRLDYILHNNNHLDKETLDIYAQEGQIPVKLDETNCHEIFPKTQLITADLSLYSHEEHLLRHSPDKLAQTLFSLN